MTDDTNDKVLSILDNIKVQNVEPSERTETDIVTLPTSEGLAKSTKQNIDIRGKPKSGKFWKSSREKFSSINKTKGLKQDFQKKTALRIALKHSKELSQQAVQSHKDKVLERKERRRENLKRAEENKKKSEVVQVITNTAKLKRMRKKQLRFIQKRDTNKEVEDNK